jgi:hypothetical protein
MASRSVLSVHDCSWKPFVSWYRRDGFGESRMRASPSLQRSARVTVRCQRAPHVGSEESHAVVLLGIRHVTGMAPGAIHPRTACYFSKHATSLLSRVVVNYGLVHDLSNSVMARQGRSPPADPGSKGLDEQRRFSGPNVLTLKVGSATSPILGCTPPWKERTDGEHISLNYPTRRRPNPHEDRPHAAYKAACIVAIPRNTRGFFSARSILSVNCHFAA